MSIFETKNRKPPKKRSPNLLEPWIAQLIAYHDPFANADAALISDFSVHLYRFFSYIHELSIETGKEKVYNVRRMTIPLRPNSVFL